MVRLLVLQQHQLALLQLVLGFPLLPFKGGPISRVPRFVWEHTPSPLKTEACRLPRVVAAPIVQLGRPHITMDRTFLHMLDDWAGPYPELGRNGAGPPLVEVMEIAEEACRKTASYRTAHGITRSAGEYPH